MIGLNVVTILGLVEGAKGSPLLSLTAGYLCRLMSQEHVNHLTDEVYRFIESYLQDQGIAPSVREIAAGCFLSVSTVRFYLTRLEMQGELCDCPEKHEASIS